MPKARSTCSEGILREPTAAEELAIMTADCVTVSCLEEGPVPEDLTDRAFLKARKMFSKDGVCSVSSAPKSLTPLADSKARRKLTQPMESSTPVPMRFCEELGRDASEPASRWKHS